MLVRARSRKQTGLAVLDTRIPLPHRGRTYVSSRRVRLSDMDEYGRFRLDGGTGRPRTDYPLTIDDVERRLTS